MADMDHTSIQRAADLIEDADALVVAAGAGMGIDSGLPDFRGLVASGPLTRRSAAVAWSSTR